MKLGPGKVPVPVVGRIDAFGHPVILKFGGPVSAIEFVGIIAEPEQD